MSVQIPGSPPGSVSSGSITDNAVTTNKINDLAVTTGKINDLAVTTGKITDLAVTTGKINDLGVTTGKLAATAVTNAKLATNAVDTTNIVDLAVTNGKLATNSVNTAQIVNDAVTIDKIADNAVGTDQLVADSVTTAKISPQAITEDELDFLSVGEDQLQDGSVTAEKMASGSISATHLTTTFLHGLNTITAASDDYVMVSDSSASNATKKALVSDLLSIGAIPNYSVRSVTSTDTCTTDDDVLVLSSSSFTQTLFTAVGNTGKIIKIIHGGTSLTQVYTLNTTSAQTIGGIASGSYALYTNGEVLEIVSDGSNWIILNHCAVTDWVDAGALTITATGTACAKGTTSRDKFLWRRTGKDVFYRYEYIQTSGGTAGTAAYIWTLPTGLSVDTNSTLTNGASVTTLAGSIVGNGRGSDQANASGSVTRALWFVPYSSTQLIMAQLQVAANADGYTHRIAGGSSTGIIISPFALNNTNIIFLIEGSYPVTNWRP